MINVEEIKTILFQKYQKANNPKISQRYNHSIGVMEYSLYLSKKYHYEKTDKVILASLLHDYAKFENKDKYIEIVNKYNLDRNYLSLSDNILHALLGDYILKDELHIDDSEVLNAIKYHSTGKPAMSTLEKIIYISDYAELGRHGEMFEKVRQAAEISLDEAVKVESALSIENIKSRNLEVMPLTIECYEYYKQSF